MTNYYCDPVSGDNSNDGLTTSTAFESLETLFVTQGDDKIKRYNALGEYQGGGPIDSGDTIFLMTGYHGRVLRGSTRLQYYNTDYITIDKAPGENPSIGQINFRDNQKWKLQNLKFDWSLTGLGLEFSVDTVLRIEDTSDVLVDNCEIFCVDDLDDWTNVSQDSIWTLVPDAPATAGNYIITLTMTNVDDSTTDYQCFNVSDENLFAGVTDTGANKLIDDTQNFDVTLSVGMTVKNITDQTYTTITNIDSATTLSLADDIFPDVGDTYKMGWIEWDASSATITDALEVGLPAGWDSGHATASGDTMDTDPVSGGIILTFIHAGDSTRPGGRDDISGVAVSTGNLVGVADVVETETQQGINDWQKAVYGIWLDTAGDNIAITNNTIRNVLVGISGDIDSNLSVENNIINTFAGDAMQFGGKPNIIIRGNTVYNRVGELINTHGDMLQITGTPGENTGCVIEKNTMIAFQDATIPNVRNCQGMLIGAVSGQVQNNLIVTNNIHGINASNAINLDIVNNTVVRSPDDDTDVSPKVQAPSGSGCVIRNTIANTFDFTDTIYSNNIDVGVDATYEELFTDYNGLDFTLLSNSPAVNKGTVTDAPTEDILSNKRDSLPDIGCYEFVFTGLRNRYSPSGYRSVYRSRYN
jgi:hypothetical protein